jgi:hypothetical protein
MCAPEVRLTRIGSEDFAPSGMFRVRHGVGDPHASDFTFDRAYRRAEGNFAGSKVTSHERKAGARFSCAPVRQGVNGPFITAVTKNQKMRSRP